jgi:7-cyano-7-deazaguanine synthase
LEERLITMGRKGLILLSGGMDSTTLLYYVSKVLGYTDITTLFIDYGQTHCSCERRAFVEVSEDLKSVTRISGIHVNLKQFGGSALTDKTIKLPKASENKQEKVVVPYRNTIFLALASAHAEKCGIKDIFFAPNKDDFRSFLDCREEFVKAISLALSLGGKIDGVYAPFVNLSKNEIVKLGLSLNVPFGKTRTCYTSDVVACGVCDACVERINAFKSNGIVDSIPYKIKIDWSERNE